MELLLNLAWLLLALPAYWLWRARKVSRGFSSLQCLLALGCVLAILFPVVSATDDLHAMRAEIEESPVSKRTPRHAAGDRGSLWSAATHNPVAMPASSDLVQPVNVPAWQPVSSVSLIVPVPPPVERLGRAPPRFTLV